MAKQRIKQNSENPSARYESFIGGIDYNVHTSNSLNKVKMMENLEITSDGKLEVRNPLIPWDYGNDDYNIMVRVPDGYELLRTIYAPFNQMRVPFLYLVQEVDGTDRKLLYFSEVQDILDKDKYNSVQLEARITSHTLEKLNGEHLEDDHSFSTETDRLLILTTSGLGEIRSLRSGLGVNGLTFKTVPAYEADFPDIESLGVNLYKDFPYLIDNNISPTDVLYPRALSTYDINRDKNPNTSFSQGFDAKSMQVAFDYENSESLFVKAAFEIPSDMLLRELHVFYYTKITTSFLDSTSTRLTPGPTAFGRPILDWDYFTDKANRPTDLASLVRIYIYGADGSSSFALVTLSTLLTIMFGTPVPASVVDYESFMHYVMPEIWWLTGDANVGLENPNVGNTTQHNATPLLTYGLGAPLEETHINMLGRQVFKELWDGSQWYIKASDFGKLGLLSYRADILPSYKVSVTRNLVVKVHVHWGSSTMHVVFKSENVSNRGKFSVGDDDASNDDVNGFDNRYDEMNQIRADPKLKDWLKSENSNALLLGNTYAIPDEKRLFHKVNIEFDGDGIPVSEIQVTMPNVGLISSTQITGKRVFATDTNLFGENLSNRDRPVLLLKGGS